MKHFGYLLLILLFFNQCRNKEENIITQFPGKPEVPASLKEDHTCLLEKLQRIALFQDSSGLAAKKLKNLMQHHFQEEEDYVLSPLGLLPMLASGKIPEQSEDVIKLTEKFKTQLTHMNIEHQMIKAYMEEMKLADKDKNHPEIIEFETEVHKHAKSEEDVFFPAAILVGDFLKLKSARTGQ